MTIESVESLRNSFRSGFTLSLHFRKKQLRSLFQMLEDHEKDICEALEKDLNKSVCESKLTEILLCKQEISYLIKNMDSWLSNEKVSKSFLSLFDSLWVQRQPYGVALCIGAWNFPIFVTIMPLAGLLAAGNCVILKPSELSVNIEKLLSELLPKYLDENACRVELGGPARTTEILKEKFDYIVYTGNSSVGKIVMEAAAKHLTPVTLELGAKSPVYLDKNSELKMAVKRIIWGKFLNAGQTCVAPDYLLCHKDVKDEFIKMSTEMIEEFYTADASASPDYPRMINEKQFKRVMDLIKQTKGKIILGGEGKEDKLYVAPTVVILDSIEDILMQSEIFGPILPVIAVTSEDPAIDIINKGEKPLSVYVFSNKEAVFKKFEKGTTSGAIVFNDCIFQAGINGLPFGGVGGSGIGRYHGKFSIDEFSHQRAVLDKSKMEIFNNMFRYPPYNTKKEGWIDWGLKSDTKSKACTIL